MRKNLFVTLSTMVVLCVWSLASCGKDDNNMTEGGGNNPSQALSSPTGLNSQASGTSIYVTWQSVNNATSYNVYWSSDASNSYTKIGTSYSTSYTDNNPLSGYNYYKVSAVNSNGESPQSSYTSCYYYNGSGNNGGGNNNDNVPSAPIGLTATQAGPKAYPYVSLSWNYNSSAHHYVIYRSTSQYGSYSKIGTTLATSYSDENISNGKTYYYKVTAANSNNKESGYSNIASVTINTTIIETPGIASCSVTKGTNQITIKWTYASGSGYSAPDEVRLSTSTYKTIFTWTSASSKKSHTVKTTDLTTSYGDLAYENTLYLEVKNSAGSGKGAKIMWNWKTNTGYIMGDLCGYTTF